MSEHIQPAPDQASREHERPQMHERTPGVAHEAETFDFGLIVKVGIGLGVTVLAVVVLLGWLLGGLENVNKQPVGELSALAIEDARRPLGQRLDNVPPPHLEGIERESSLLVVRTENGEEQRFFTSADVRVRIGKNEKARLFELREGQPVTLAYYMPGGVGGGLGVVTSITSPSPPGRAEIKKAGPELPDIMRTLNGVIVRVVPRSIAASREWAEVQMQQYGWTDRDKGIVHVPIEKAMDIVSDEFRTKDNKKQGDGRRRLPTRSSSGRATAGGKP